VNNKGAKGELATSAERGLDPAARIYFDYALTGIFESDGQGKIRRANPAASSILGMDVGNLLGIHLSDLAAERSTRKLHRHFDMLAEQGINHVELDFVAGDAGLIVVELASIQAGEDLVIHVFDDVTEQRRAAADLQRARAEAEAATQAKTEFLANISHELRTPINGVLGLAQLARRSDSLEQQRDYLDRIVRSGQRLLQIVNDLLDAARLESGRLDFERSAIAVADLIDDLAGVGAQAVGKPVEVRYELAPDVPAWILGDRLRIGQCLANLMSNAIKFTQKGEVRLAIDVERRPQQPQLLRFRVMDTGIGIDPEVLPRLFTQFSQADSSTARRFGGSGLGLKIARDFARAMGGELVADSVIGKGSCFTMTLELQSVDAPVSDPVAQTALEDVPDEFRGRRLLVAEDDETNQLVIMHWLALAGIEAEIVCDGQQAIDRLAHAPTPELILMDVQMPGLDGIEATRRIRQEGHRMPIIALTAGTRLQGEQCLAAGMHDWLSKPLDIDELWGCLTRWLPPAGSETNHPVQHDSVEERFLRNQEVLQRARLAFATSHGADAQKLSRMYAQGDVPAMLLCAHGLRGAAALLGYDSTAQCAGEIEHALERGLPGDKISALIERLHELLRSIDAN
jgi:two-component system sensor histidine kinase/response regulator